MKKVYLSPSNQDGNAYAYGGTNEAVQCEKIAAACEKALQAAGVEVMMGAREKTMQVRCRESDSFGADIHVPIHTNAFNGSVNGTRLFCYSVQGEGYKASQAIFDALAPITPGTSENIQANPSLYEVRTPKAPTVYVEAEFHDVPETAKWIVENTGAIGQAIAKGICGYLGVEPAPVTERLYRVQVGAYREKANAQKMLQALKAAGFDGFITE